MERTSDPKHTLTQRALLAQILLQGCDRNSVVVNILHVIRLEHTVG